MKQSIAIILSFLLLSVSFAEHDIDIQTHVTGGEHSAGEGGLGEWQGSFSLDYSGNVPISDNVSLLLNQSIDGMTEATEFSPMREYNHPAKSISYLGLGFYGAGVVQAQAFSELFFNSEYIGFPVDQTFQTHLIDASMLQRSRNGVDLFFEFPIKQMLLSGNLLYSDLLYDYNRSGDILLNQHDADLWGSGLMGVSFAEEKVWIKAGGLLKHDLNEFSGYNFSKAFAGIESNFKLFKKKLDIRADLYGRFYASTLLGEKHNNYADGIGFLPRLRFYWRLKARTYLKADLEYEIAPANSGDLMVKQRYELAFRKAWKNYTSFEIGSWASMGGFTPRICMYGNSNVHFNEKFEMVYGVRSYLFGAYSKSKVENGSSDSKTTYIFDGYNYYRTDIDLMLRQKIGLNSGSDFMKHMALYGGARYRIYSPIDSYSDLFESPNVSTLRFYLGVTSFL